MALSNFELHGEMNADGGDATDTLSGGGSAGSVSIATAFLEGAGSITASGGAGMPVLEMTDAVGAATSGGGGGGGVLVFDNEQTPSNSPFDFSGWLHYDGGAANAGAEPGFIGSVTWPDCPPGYGNRYDTNEMCALCDIGTYSSSWSSQPCQQCKNKPTHSYYTEVRIAGHLVALLC